MELDDRAVAILERREREKDPVSFNGGLSSIASKLFEEYRKHTGEEELRDEKIGKIISAYSNEKKWDLFGRLEDVERVIKKQKLNYHQLIIVNKFNKHIYQDYVKSISNSSNQEISTQGLEQIVNKNLTTDYRKKVNKKFLEINKYLDNKINGIESNEKKGDIIKFLHLGARGRLLSAAASVLFIFLYGNLAYSPVYRYEDLGKKPSSPYNYKDLEHNLTQIFEIYRIYSEFVRNDIKPEIALAKAYTKYNLSHQCKQHGIQPEITWMIAEQESNMMHYLNKSGKIVISPKGARGAMQLMYKTARIMGFKRSDIEDWNTNIEVGVKFIKYLAERYDADLGRKPYKNLNFVLAAYNAGYGIVDKWKEMGWDGNPDKIPAIGYSETRYYIKKVRRELDAQQMMVDKVKPQKKNELTYNRIPQGIRISNANKGHGPALRNKEYIHMRSG